MKKYTVIFLAVALVAVFAATTMANEWNLYGNARMATFYTSDKLEDRQFLDPADRSSIKDTQWNLQGNSRIGATIKGDMIDARFELGIGSNTVINRRLYGVWKFTEGWGLKIGQDYTPITFFLSGQVFDTDNGLLQVGNAYGSRKGQVALEGKAGPGMLKVALIDQNQVSVSGLVFESTDPAIISVGAATESYIPKIEASYMMNFADGMSGHVFGGYQTQKIYYNELDALTNDVLNRKSDTLNSWVVGIGADLNFGPMFVKPQVSYYLNGAGAGWLGTTLKAGGLLPSASDISALPVFIDGASEDVKTLMAMLALGFSPTEQLTLEAGVGYLYTNINDGPYEKNTYLEYYLQAVYAMAPGGFLVPEVGFRDFGKVEFGDPDEPDADLGNLFYIGAKWQINF